MDVDVLTQFGPAEHRHDRVADELLEGATVARDGRAHDLEVVI